MGLTSLLNVSKLGLFASQEALKITSHNISNVNTPGYSRQSASLQAMPNMRSMLASGDGVIVEQVVRNVDRLLDTRINLSQQELGRLQTRDRYLPLIEDVFNELDSDGLSGRLDSLYQAAERLADNPFNPVARTDFLAQSDSVATFMKMMYDDLDRATMPVDQEITYAITEVNTILQNLKEINQRIISQEYSGNPAMDLKDQRTEQLNKLGTIMDIQSFENRDGGVTVLTGGGKLLLERDFAAYFERGGGVTASGFPGITYLNQPMDISANFQSGNLKGLLEIRDDVIYGTNGWLDKIEQLSDELRWQFNQVHSQSVGNVLFTSQTGAFDLGGDLTTSMNALVVDTSAAGYVRSPPDIRRVVNGDITFAFSQPPNNTVNNLPSETISIAATDSIQDVVNKLNGLTGLNASINADNRVVVTVAAPYTGYGVVEDQSGVLAALGIGVLFDGYGAGTMGVNSELVNDSQRVATARIRQDSLGNLYYDDLNNAGALALADVRATHVTLFGKNIDMGAHYSGIVGDLGSLKRRNDQDLDTREASHNALKDFRESVSGISLDEELTDLIKFQRAFQASSRMISVADELLQSILQMV